MTEPPTDDSRLVTAKTRMRSCATRSASATWTTAAGAVQSTATRSSGCAPTKPAASAQTGIVASAVPVTTAAVSAPTASSPRARRSEPSSARCRTVAWSSPATASTESAWNRAIEDARTPNSDAGSSVREDGGDQRRDDELHRPDDDVQQTAAEQSGRPLGDVVDCRVRCVRHPVGRGPSCPTERLAPGEGLGHDRTTSCRRANAPSMRSSSSVLRSVENFRANRCGRPPSGTVRRSSTRPRRRSRATAGSSAASRPSRSTTASAARARPRTRG